MHLIDHDIEPYEERLVVPLPSSAQGASGESENQISMFTYFFDLRAGVQRSIILVVQMLGRGDV